MPESILDGTGTTGSAALVTGEGALAISGTVTTNIKSINISGTFTIESGTNSSLWVQRAGTMVTSPADYEGVSFQNTDKTETVMFYIGSVVSGTVYDDGWNIYPQDNAQLNYLVKSGLTTWTLVVSGAGTGSAHLKLINWV